MNIRKKITQIVAKVFLALYLPEKAIELAKIALNIWSDDLTFLKVLKEGYGLTYNLEGFMGVYKTTIALLPNRIWLRKELGNILFGGNKYEEALSYYEYGVQNWPQEENKYGLANIYAGLGLCNLSLGQWEQV